MAKKKKKTTKAHSQTRKENGHSVSGQRKELVQRVYNFSSKEISRRLPESNSRLRIGMDFDTVRMKRRVAATLATLDELTKQVPDITEEVPEIFHLAEDWAQLNAIAAPAYDCEEEENTATLGAAIWMLDQIREEGKIRDAIRLMPKDDGPLDQIYIPPVWDPCHSDEVLLGMLYIIQNRNQDCVGQNDPKPTKEQPSRLERFHMDFLTAEGKHHQQVDSRIRFETILSMIPQDSIDRAVQHYQELFWDWVRRYYTCRNIILQKEIQLDKDRKAFNEKLRSDIANADIVLYQLGNILAPPDDEKDYWFPTSYIYHSGKQVIWQKLKSASFCQKIAPLFGVKTVEELKERIKDSHIDRSMSYNGAWDAAPCILSSIKIDDVGTLM